MSWNDIYSAFGRFITEAERNRNTHQHKGRRRVGKVVGVTKPRKPYTKEVAKALSRELGTETKKVFNYGTANPTPTNSQTFTSCEIVQGIGYNHRLGSKCTVKGFSVRLQPDLGTRTAALYRVMFVLPRKAQTASDLPTDAITPIDTDEFIVWYDKVIPLALNPTGDASYPTTTPEQGVFKIWKEWDREVKFDDNASTPESLTPILVWHNIASQGSATTECGFNYHITTYFKG